MFSKKVRYAIQILAELEATAPYDECPTLQQLKETLLLDLQELRSVVGYLCRAGYMRHNIHQKTFQLARKLNEVSLYELVTLLDGGIALGGMHLYGWSREGAKRCETAIMNEDHFRYKLEDRLREINVSAFLQSEV